MSTYHRPVDDRSGLKWHRSWGPWRLDPKDFVLYTDPDSVGYRYEIDLETCTTSAQVLDWICQISEKRWNAGELQGLVAAFNDVLEPQTNLCSWGRNKKMSPAKVRFLVNNFRWDSDEDQFRRIINAGLVDEDGGQ